LLSSACNASIHSVALGAVYYLKTCGCLSNFLFRNVKIDPTV
jgi:hypothetical protein